MMPTARTVGILCVVLAAGCAAVTKTPPGAMPQSGSVTVEPPVVAGPNQYRTVAAEPRSETKDEATAALAPPPAEPRPSAKIGGEANGIESVTRDQAPPARSQGAAKPVQPPAAEQRRKHEDPPPVARKPEPPLDVAALKARLRDTDAIGVFTKLALRNQVDDLLNQFRAHYLNGRKTSVAALRQPYDMLVLKVLALIQNSDPSLARTISGSREAIWGILADPDKFNSIS